MPETGRPRTSRTPSSREPRRPGRRCSARCRRAGRRRGRCSCSTSGPAGRPTVSGGEPRRRRGRRSGQRGREAAERADRLDLARRSAAARAGTARASGRTSGRCRTAQSSVSPIAVTWKLLATTTCRAFGNWPATRSPSAGGGDRVELAAEHQDRDVGVASRTAGSGGPAGLVAGADGHCVHQSSDCQSEPAYSCARERRVGTGRRRCARARRRTAAGPRRRRARSCRRAAGSRGRRRRRRAPRCSARTGPASVSPPVASATSRSSGSRSPASPERSAAVSSR